MGDERLLVRVRTASYAVPGGFPILVTHVGECGNHVRDAEMVRCVKGANPKVMTELVAAARAVMAVMGYPPECRIDKDNSMGVLYQEHSQDSSFLASSGTTASLGTCSLVGEMLIEGAQGTPSGAAAISVGRRVQSSSSWPSGLSGLGSSEKQCYKGMMLNRSSDEDYVPSSIVIDDVAMSLGDNKTSKANGLGDSKHASSPGIDDDKAGESLPSTVPYSLSATPDILGALAEYGAGALPPRPSELDSSDEDDDEMDVSEQSAQVVPDVLTDSDRIERLERGVEADRDLFDRLRDTVEDLECEIASLRTWKQNVDENGCSRCSGKAVKPANTPRPAVPLSSSASSSRREATPAVPTRPPPVVPSKSGARTKQAQAATETPASARVTKTRTPRDDLAVVAPAVNMVAPPVAQVTILRRPTYATSDEERVVSSYASVAAGNSKKNGYSVVAGRKCFVSKKAVTPDPITSIPVRERHLTIKFVRERDTKSVLPTGVTVGIIRDALNRSLYALKCNAYFSIASLGKWGDVMLTLAATRVGDVAGYYPAFRETLEGLNIGQFTFIRDTEKCKVFVGMVPLSRFGGGWQPSEWEGRTAFDHLSADIENSNPGIVVAAKPSWAGRLHKLKERRVNNAGLILVL